jgi:transcriptional regulator with XRE-family HTH domain
MTPGANTKSGDRWKRRRPHPTDILAGMRVRLRRKELGLSLTDLASRLGITFQQVQKYENGLNRISASRLQGMSIALGVPVAYFFPVKGESPEAQAQAALAVIETGGLLRDFAGIGSPSVREALRELVEALAEESPA